MWSIRVVCLCFPAWWLRPLISNSCLDISGKYKMSITHLMLLVVCCSEVIESPSHTTSASYRTRYKITKWSKEGKNKKWDHDSNDRQLRLLLLTCHAQNMYRKGYQNNKLLFFYYNVETGKFFKALSQVGTDFTMMTLLLPSRSRKELKVSGLSQSSCLRMWSDLGVTEQIQERREE